MKTILDPTFKYRSSVETDIRKTFARVRRQQRAAAAKMVAEATKPTAAVRPIRKVAT